METSGRFSESEANRELDATPIMPVDSECTVRFEALVSGKKLEYCNPQTTRISFPEEEVKKLFTSPLISEETSNKVRAETSHSGVGTFKDAAKKVIEEKWVFVDKAARSGMKLSSIFLLAAESLLRAHQQFPGDQGYFSRAEVGSLIFLLGPLARQIYDQFARVAIKSIKVRRDNVLGVFKWPYPEARAHLEQLPFLGKDLFDGRFLEAFVKEVDKHKVVAQTSFCLQESVPTTLQPMEVAPSRSRNLRGLPGRRGRKRAKPTVALPVVRRQRGVGSLYRRQRGGGSRLASRGRGRGRARSFNPSFSDSYYAP